MLLRTCLVLAATVSMMGCGGGGHSSAPSPVPQPNLTPAPTEVWSIGGRVTAYGSNVGVSGAHVTADGATPADTDADGNYRLTYKLLPTTPDIKVTVAANDFMVTLRGQWSSAVATRANSRSASATSAGVRSCRSARRRSRARWLFVMSTP